MIAEILLGFLDLVQPYLLKRIIEFIKKPQIMEEHFFSSDMQYGVSLVVLLSVVELARVFFDRQKDLKETLYGDKAKNLMRTVIFDKFSLISNATNKSFQEGQILELIHTDSQKA